MGGTIGIIQARMGSRRLPGKILAPLAGRTMLGLLAARLGGARVDEWWLATTSERDDDVTEAWGHALRLRVYRGAGDDVLSRYTAIIRERRPEWIVRISGDSPFCDRGLVDLLLDARDKEAGDATCLHVVRGNGAQGDDAAPAAPPLGYAAQVARADAVLRAEAEIPDHQAFHRTLVLSWLEEREGRGVPLPHDWPSRPDWRWTVDTFDDLTMTRSAFELFGLEAPTLSYPEMVRALDPHPEITAMNRDAADRTGDAQ